jgi:RNA-directed DNA polymerase
MLDIPKLCRILNVNSVDLQQLVLNIDKYYYEKSTPKLDKNGQQLTDAHGRPRTRVLRPSTGLLKAVQTKIYKKILRLIKLPDYAFGGVSKRDNVLNAKMHQGNKFFFNTDLRNFYPSISHRAVYAMFASRGFAPEVANILTKLVSFKGELPQGTPTSPYLANLIFVKVGKLLQDYATEHNLTFTTFVDDITLSSKYDFKDRTDEILDIITSNGFTISHNKTFYQTRMPKVTNVIVKNNGLALSPSYKARIDSIEDKDSPQAKGTINYYNRVSKVSKMRKRSIKRLHG